MPITETLTCNPAGIELIRHYEGLRLRAYQDTGGVWTIGYGSTKNVTRGMVISPKQAEERLREDLDDVEGPLNACLKAQLNENEFSACCSFAFNVGVNAFKRSTLLKLLNSGQKADASNEFGRWVKDNGRVLPGLVKRRDAERELFLTPVSLTKGKNARV